MDDTTLLELIPDYALGLLSEAERSEVTALLARSAQARTLLSDYEEMLGGLATLVPPHAAPAQLTADFGKRLAASESEASALSGPLAIVPRAKPARPWLRTAALAAAALLVVAVAILAAVRVLTPTKTPEQIAMEAILADPNVSKTPFVFSIAGSQAEGVVYSIPDRTEAVLELRALPALPSNQQYQIWVIDSKAPQGAGLIGAVEDPLTHALLRASDKLANFDLVAITVEPQGGSPAPTSNPIAVAKLHADQTQ